MPRAKIFVPTIGKQNINAKIFFYSFEVDFIDILLKELYTLLMKILTMLALQIPPSEVLKYFVTFIDRMKLSNSHSKCNSLIKLCFRKRNKIS